MSLELACPQCGLRIRTSGAVGRMNVVCPACHTPLGGGPSSSNRGLPSIPRATILAPQSSKVSKALLWTGVIGGVVVVGLIVLVLLAAMFTGTGKNTSSSSTRIEIIMAHDASVALNRDKQQMFNIIHPVGNARSVTVHEVTVNAWKHGQPTNRFEDVERFTVRFTLYWQGPLTADGFTKLTMTYDNEAQRWVGYQILETNGMTNNDASEAAGTLLGTWLQYEAQKAGAEQATRDYLNNR